MLAAHPRHASGHDMNFILAPRHILFAALAGWVNKRQEQIIESQNAQIEALR